MPHTYTLATRWRGFFRSKVRPFLSCPFLSSHLKSELARKDKIIAGLQQRLFGSSSEKLDPNQLQLEMDELLLGKPEPLPEPSGETSARNSSTRPTRPARRSSRPPRFPASPAPCWHPPSQPRSSPTNTMITSPTTASPNASDVSGVCSALRRLLLQPLHRFHSLQIYDTYEVTPPYALACRCGL